MEISQKVDESRYILKDQDYLQNFRGKNVPNQCILPKDSP